MRMAYLVSWRHGRTGRFTPARLFGNEPAADAFVKACNLWGFQSRILAMEIDDGVAEGQAPNRAREEGRNDSSQVGQSDTDPGNYGDFPDTQDIEANDPPSRPVRSRPEWWDDLWTGSEAVAPRRPTR